MTDDNGCVRHGRDEHFLEMLDFVATNYAHTLFPDHIEFIRDFRELPKEAQCLYVRLVNRKGRVFARNRLRYPELGELAPALAALADGGWTQPPGAGDFDEVLNFLTRAEIYDVLLPRFAGMSRSLKKPQLIEFARAHVAAEDFIGSLDEADLRYIIDLYDASIRWVDRHVGLLLEYLERKGLLEKTIVVVTSDHGEAFQENPERHGYIAHHGAYEPVVRIPLLVKRPGQTAGSVQSHYVQQVDILPAMLDAVGLPAVPGLPSTGLGEHTARRPVVTEWYPRDRGREHHFPTARLGLYEGRLKYVLEGGSEEFLFDLDESPWETKSILDRESARSEELRAALLEAVPPADSTLGETSDAIDPALEEQLRALGYIN